MRQVQPPEKTHSKRSVGTGAISMALPSTGFMRLPQIIGDPDATPPIVGVFPVSKSTWWRGIREGRYPSAVKLGPNSSGWHVEKIRALIQQVNEKKAA